MNSVILSFILTKIMVFFVEDVVMITIPDAKSRDFAEMCPQNCTCYNATIDCSKRNLTELPKFISYNTSILDLSGNQLKSLPLSFFDNLWNLQVINVSYNEIEELGTIGNDQHLKKSWKLHTIDLSHNKIQQINMYFPRFKGLRKLILSYNLLQEITPASFLNVPYLEQLFLDHNQLRSLTRLWFVVKSNLKSLHLMYNNISFIEPSTFYYTEDISLIDLSGNFIKYLDSGLFLELQKLSHLYLDCNIISHISEFAFTGLDQLQVLNLSSNHISVGDKEMDTAFIPLKRLEVLDLSKNSALLIPSTAFQGLANLKTLNLMFNNIMVIEEKAFENLKSLKLLELSTSSLLCGCSVKWLRDWLNLHPMGKNINIACSLPLWLKNKNVMDILDSELSCGSTEFSPIRPKITLQPQSTFANKLGNTSLKCSAVSLMQTMDIVWFKNNLIIDKAKVSNTIQIVNEIQYECTSVLVLKNIKNEDNGAYSCYASNLYGSDLSTRVNISVVESPRLSSELKPIIISRSGETVLIPCKAEGQPLPSISFTKLNYRQNIHAFVDKRVSYNNHMFGITNLKIEDSGLYVCCAKNVAGVANKTITLTVLEKPKFTHPMDSKAVLLGDTAVLNCIVSGNPPPKIQWYKNDTLLYPDLSSRIKLSNLWLVIVSFDYSDEGSYGCEASNSLGTARQTARLTVHNKTLLGLSSKKSPFLSIVIITVVAVVILISFALVSLFCFKKRHKNKEELADDKLLGNLPKAYTLHYTDKLTPVPVSKSVSLKEEAPYLSDSKDDSDNWTLDSAMAVDLAEDDSGISLVYPKDNCSGNITVDRCIDPRVHSFSVEKLNEALQIKNISSYSTLRSSHRKQSNCYLLFNSLNSSLVDRTTDIPLISLKNNNSALVAHKKNKILRDVCDSSLLKYDKTFVGVVPKAPTLKEKYLASSRIESEFISNASLSESLMIGKTRVS